MTQRWWAAFGDNDIISNSATEYGGPSGWGKAWQAADDLRLAWVVGASCTLKAIHARVQFALGGGDSITLTANVNGVNTSLVAVITNADVLNVVTALGDVPLAAGDRVTVEIIGVGISTLVDCSGSFEFEGTAFTFQTSGGTEDVDLPTSGTRYVPLVGTDDPTSSPATHPSHTAAIAVSPVPCEIVSCAIELETAPGAGTGRAFQIRHNGALVGATLVIDELNTSGVLTLDPPIAVAAGDGLQMESRVDSGVPAATQYRFGTLWNTENLGQCWINSTPNEAISTAPTTQAHAGHFWGDQGLPVWEAAGVNTFRRRGLLFGRSAQFNAIYTDIDVNVWTGGTAEMGVTINDEAMSGKRDSSRAVITAGNFFALLEGQSLAINVLDTVLIEYTTTEPEGGIPFNTQMHAYWAYTDLEATPDFPPVPPAPFQGIAECPPDAEFDEIIDPLGNVFRLGNNTRRFLLAEAGTGLPPFHYVTQAGPFQHGETVIDFFARPRIITQRFRWPARFRSEWWALRTAMVDAVRPNRQRGGATRTEALTLRKYLPDGSRWDLRVMPDRAPNFAQREGRWDEWALDEMLRFIAHDPIYFDPDESVQDSDLTDDQLTFSDVVPGFVGGADFEPGERIYFGGGREVSVVYAGTWLSWPIVEIHGPITNPTVSNDASGAQVGISYSPAKGEIITIVTEPGSRSVSSPIGGDLIGSVTEASVLTNLFLAPEPLAEDGINTVRLTGADITDDTKLRVRWHTRKAGLGI